MLPKFKEFCLVFLLTVGVFFATVSSVLAQTAFTFASLGDAQEGSADLLKAANQIINLNPSLVIYNGDLADDNGTTLSTSASAGDRLDLKVTSFKTAGIFDRTFFVRGNHDNHVSGSMVTWETFFSTSPNIKSPPAGVTNYVAMSATTTSPNNYYLNYSFDYGNARFIGLDSNVDGDLTDATAEYNFLDARLTEAETGHPELTHAFLFWHAPDYCVESNHCDCTAKLDGSCTAAKFVTIINKHPIVSATFHGHEHILGWVHVDSARVPTVTHPYEEFITSPASSDNSYNSYLYSNRVDYYSSGTGIAFAGISVNGGSFTVSLYRNTSSSPVWSKTFVKSGTTPTPTATPGATSTPVLYPGDANGDTKVTEADYAIWLTYYNQTVSGGASVGDFSGDGKVSGIDYTIWLAHFNGVVSTPTPTPTPTKTPTPGPTGTKTPTPTPSKTPTPKPTSPTGSRPLKYYLVDRVLNNSDYAKLAGWGINTAVVNLPTNGTTTEWQSVYNAANAAGISIVVWPNIGQDNNCGWESPFNNPVNGSYIETSKNLLSFWKDKAIGIVTFHEPMWSTSSGCKDSVADLSQIYSQIHAYTGNPNFKVWGYINTLNASTIKSGDGGSTGVTDYTGPNDLGKIMDVALIWLHCAGNVEGPCEGSNSAISRINEARTVLNSVNSPVESVYVIQTFTSGGYGTKFTLDQLETYSCKFLNTNALDGFGYYTWDAGWWPDLHSWTDLQPAVPYVYNTCVTK